MAVSVIVSDVAGTVSFVDGKTIKVTKDRTGEIRNYSMRKFTGLNEKTCLNQKPIVVEGERTRGQFAQRNLQLQKLMDEPLT